MSPAFYPFVIEIDYGSSFVEVERDWHGAGYSAPNISK